MPYEMEHGMFNHVTQEYEPTGRGALLTIDDSKARAYIPQSPPALSLYDIYRQLGASPFDAMFKVLKACVGEKS